MQLITTQTNGAGSDASQITPAARLGELEDLIEKSFEEQGLAFDEINSRQLYQELGFKTFEQYLKERWGRSISYGYKFIRAAKEAAKCPIGHKPANVHQALQRRKSQPTTGKMTIVFDPDKELSAIERTAERWEKALDPAEYQAFVERVVQHLQSTIYDEVAAL